jgi:hypothetical protein
MLPHRGATSFTRLKAETVLSVIDTLPADFELLSMFSRTEVAGFSDTLNRTHVARQNVDEEVTIKTSHRCLSSLLAAAIIDMLSRRNPPTNFGRTIHWRLTNATSERRLFTVKASMSMETHT